MNRSAINLALTETVDYTIKYGVASPLVTGTMAYFDDFEGWMERAPRINSEHPDYPSLRLEDVDMERQEGGVAKVKLAYKSWSIEASYPGREPGPVKRYNLEISMSEEPLLTHDFFSDLEPDIVEGLQELMSGNRSKEDFARAREVLEGNEPGVAALEMIARGTQAYYNPGLVWVERLTEKDLDGFELDKLRTIMDPPGDPPSFGTDRDWLFIGASPQQTDDGSFWTGERRWQLSEKGGWDENLYGTGA
jgi:hypothetical protein